jgi:hypothetical protein
MATHIVISNEDYATVDDFHIQWEDKGNAMPSIPNTIHYVVWNNSSSPNEIQNKDASTGAMTGNTELSTASDAVGSTTIADLLTWGDTRKGQIETAIADYGTAVADDAANGTTNAAGKTWVDYDPNYS